MNNLTESEIALIERIREEAKTEETKRAEAKKINDDIKIGKMNESIITFIKSNDIIKLQYSEFFEKLEKMIPGCYEIKIIENTRKFQAINYIVNSENEIIETRNIPYIAYNRIIFKENPEYYITVENDNYSRNVKNEWKMKIHYPHYLEIQDRMYKTVKKVHELITEQIQIQIAKAKAKEIKLNAKNMAIEYLQEKYPNATVKADYTLAPYHSGPGSMRSREKREYVCVKFSNDCSMSFTYRMENDKLELGNYSTKISRNVDKFKLLDFMSKM